MSGINFDRKAREEISTAIIVLIQCAFFFGFALGVLATT